MHADVERAVWQFGND